MADAPILAAYAWKSNAELIEACHRLGYLRDEDLTLDLTYGRGVWWKRWRPTMLYTNDIDQSKRTDKHDDYRDATGWWSDSFDVVAFDPPYVAKGGRDTSGIPDFDNRFGLKTAPLTPRKMQCDINAGLSSAYRVVKPRGIVLVKCKDYISGGALWLGTHHTLTHAMSIGFDVVDRLEHTGGLRPQPMKTNPDGSQTQQSQQHARRNLSTLFVLRKRSTIYHDFSCEG